MLYVCDGGQHLSMRSRELKEYYHRRGVSRFQYEDKVGSAYLTAIGAILCILKVTILHCGLHRLQSWHLKARRVNFAELRSCVSHIDKCRAREICESQEVRGDYFAFSGVF